MHTTLFIWAACLIATVTLAGGLWPLYYRANIRFYAFSEAAVSGLFLGAGLFHMLPDAVSAFTHIQSNHQSPTAYFLCAASFAVLFILEYLARHRGPHGVGGVNYLTGWLVMAALSVHSLIGGMAIGLNQRLGDILIVFIALLAHKATDSFALVINLRRSGFSKIAMTTLLGIFVWITPGGMAVAHWLKIHVAPQHYIIWEAVFNALAAGSFIYIATLEGVGRQLLFARRPSLPALIMMLAGLGVMGLLAVWI